MGPAGPGPGPPSLRGPQTADDCKKNHLRSCMLQPRLTSLSLMSIESERLEDIDLHDIVRSFAENKSRKKYF